MFIQRERSLCLCPSIIPFCLLFPTAFPALLSVKAVLKRPSFLTTEDRAPKEGLRMDKQRLHVNPTHYAWLTKKFSPPSPLLSGLFRAFWVGGAVCVLGQCITDASAHWMQLNARDASAVASITLIFLTAILTGIGVFDNIAKYAGAGTFVPITGFANAMVSPALEFRSEGLVPGAGTKLFTIAGPVLVYGVGSSVLYGLIYALFLR